MARILTVILCLTVLAATLTLLTGGRRGDGLIAQAPVRVQNFV